ncbi:MAG: hypothetical protein ACYCWN_05460 [Ferrimicrobium sp.]|jgi:hypothetical protein|uniref:TadE-like protein n=1 Tax=Ferrimicrobium acidiphilum TaxID=121039 RepID=A0ABV3Y3M4_9ACTN|nr:hypothetical protein [Ferrimicrobium sp.]MCL5974055.1 hypothetical protein [Actinomycetota bacterium]
MVSSESLVEHKYEAGFIDLITMIFVSVVVLAILIPFVIGMVRIVALKQQLDQSAWNLLRSAMLTGTVPAHSLHIDNHQVTTILHGSLDGCAVSNLTLTTAVSLPILSLLGKSIGTYIVSGSATIGVGAYRTPDVEGFNCASPVYGL